MPMDPKRLVLSVIFAVSLFVLWENWGRYNTPPKLPTVATQTNEGIPSATPGLPTTRRSPERW
jgi:hypothetical protein